MSVYSPRIQHWLDFRLISKYPPVYIIFPTEFYCILELDYHHLIQKYLTWKFHTKSYIWHLKNIPMTAALLYIELRYRNRSDTPSFPRIWASQWGFWLLVLTHCCERIWKYLASVRPVLLALSFVQFLPDFCETYIIMQQCLSHMRI